ncbi:Hypothetical predicted protein [Mytilus galloprovincialis]|uniref:Uncharacterized protein n=1 Tax=Mytilus galloprovincialis TaxID=29158 RepID=A0A8B6H063_MYTGA|nr:Hypothetical predicted protein [Mytilus galloprovincialis]
MASRIKTDTGKKYGMVSGQKPVSLTESQTHVTIQGFIANVESKLTYVNNRKDSIETRYVFPIDDMSAVYKFEAYINGRHIIAECQDKQQATINFEEATSTGKTAFFLSESKYAGDIFVCKLGNLDAGETAVLTMAYVVELSVQPDGDLNFVLPYVLNTRYSSAGDAGDTRYSVKPVKLGFTASVKGHHTIKSVRTNRDDLQLQISDDKHSAEIKLKDIDHQNRDLEFSVSYEKVSKPEAILEVGDRKKDGLLKEDVLMLNFIPDLKNHCGNVKREFIFVMDRSGSMKGERMEKSKAALLLFLKSLPVGCLFNIVSFGSDYSFLFDRSQQYNEESLAAAKHLQNEMMANMGGTNILSPLSAIYSMENYKEYPRQIFLLTDGEVRNTEDVVNLVGQNSHNSRVFTFGVGHGASTSLIKNVAKAGAGRATFIKDEKDNMKAKVRMCSKTCLETVLKQRSEQVIRALEFSMEDNLKENHSHVAFFAYMSNNWNQLSKHKRLVYDVVDLNNGNGYNKANGEFTVPSSGLYVFHVSTGAYDRSYASVELVSQGRIRNIGWADSGDHNDRTFATTVTPLQLNKGDVVYTRTGIGNGGKFIESNSYIRTSFSGVKIN